MSYCPIATPVALPPRVKRLVRKLELHYLAPAHALFRLPIPNYRINGEFAFAISHLLLGAVAGLSTTVYEQRGGNGARFKGLLLEYYPFLDEPAAAPAPDVAAEVLWSVFRNSLAHDLGFDVERRAKTPKTKLLLAKTETRSGIRGLTERMIECLENSAVRPRWEATVLIRPDATVLSVDTLYWGVRCMTERLLADHARIARAEAFLASLQFRTAPD